MTPEAGCLNPEPNGIMNPEPNGIRDGRVGMPLFNHIFAIIL